MKKKIGSWLQLVVLLAGFFLPSLASYRTVEAKTISGIVTSMSVTDAAGNPLTSGLDMWGQFRLYAEFALPNNIVEEGDTTVIQVPNEITFPLTAPFDVRTTGGELVAKGTFDGSTKTVTLTYTSYASGKSNVTGNFFFYGRVDHSVVKTDQDIDLNITVEGTPIYAGKIHYNGPPGQYSSKLEKSGWQDNNDSTKLQYELAINRDMLSFQNVVITDYVRSPGLELVPDSFQVFALDWAWDNGDWTHSNHADLTAQTDIQIASDKRSFTINLGNLTNRGILINYKVKLPYTPVDGEVFLNDAAMNANGSLVEDDTASTTYFVAGGTAEGYVFSIDLTKTDESGQPLAGAVFEVTRDRNGVVVGTITTGTDGKAVFNNLLKDNYTIREVTPPPGYKPLATTIPIGPDDFGTTKVASRTITNEKDAQPKQVSISKINLGGQEIAGAKIKIRDTQGTEVASWTSEAGKSKELTLMPGEYVFHEEAAPNGYLTVTDITFKVNNNGVVSVVNANGNAVFVDQVGKLIITDQYDETPKKVTFSKVNLGGKEIAGAKIVIRDDQGAEVASWTSEADKSKELTLEPGEYVFHEEAAPNGYVAVTDITFKVNYDGSVTVLNANSNAVEYKDGKLVITDQYDTMPKKVTFSKVNLGGEEIAGAEIKIRNTQGTEVASWTSEAGKSKELNLVPGKYVFHEEAAPNGYVAVTDITFQVNYDGSVTVLDTNSNAVEYKDGK
ncbi:SpaA isopeptide-forming pilin-related protein, partial [Streptococcus oriscaviae]